MNEELNHVLETKEEVVKKFQALFTYNYGFEGKIILNSEHTIGLVYTRQTLAELAELFRCKLYCNYGVAEFKKVPRTKFDNVFIELKEGKAFYPKSSVMTAVRILGNVLRIYLLERDRDTFLPLMLLSNNNGAMVIAPRPIHEGAPLTDLTKSFLKCGEELKEIKTEEEAKEEVEEETEEEELRIVEELEKELGIQVD